MLQQPSHAILQFVQQQIRAFPKDTRVAAGWGRLQVCSRSCHVATCCHVLSLALELSGHVFASSLFDWWPHWSMEWLLESCLLDSLDVQTGACVAGFVGDTGRGDPGECPWLRVFTCLYMSLEALFKGTLSLCVSQIWAYSQYVIVRVRALQHRLRSPWCAKAPGCWWMFWM